MRRLWLLAALCAAAAGLADRGCPIQRIGGEGACVELRDMTCDASLCADERRCGLRVASRLSARSSGEPAPLVYSTMTTTSADCASVRAGPEVVVEAGRWASEDEVVCVPYGDRVCVSPCAGRSSSGASCDLDGFGFCLRVPEEHGEVDARQVEDDSAVAAQCWSAASRTLFSPQFTILVVAMGVVASAIAVWRV